MRIRVLILMLLVGRVSAFEIEAGNCISEAVGKGYKLDLKKEDGRTLLWLNKFIKKEKEEMIKNQTVLLVESTEHCELHIISRNPSEVLLQLKLNYSDFEKKPPYKSLKLRANWNYLYGERHVDNHFYRLVECNLEKVDLSDMYVRSCSRKEGLKVELKENKEEYRAVPSERKRQVGGGVNFR